MNFYCGECGEVTRHRYLDCDDCKINDKVQPNIYLFALDESEYWTLSEEENKWVEKMLCVYWVDLSVAYYLCELTPSIEAIVLANVPQYNDAFYEWLDKTDADGTFEAQNWRDSFEDMVRSNSDSGEAKYYHCNYMIQILAELPNGYVAHIGNPIEDEWDEFDSDEERNEALVESVREIYNSGSSQLII